MYGDPYSDEEELRWQEQRAYEREMDRVYEEEMYNAHMEQEYARYMFKRWLTEYVGGGVL